MCETKVMVGTPCFQMHFSVQSYFSCVEIAYKIKISQDKLFVLSLLNRKFVFAEIYYKKPAVLMSTNVLGLDFLPPTPKMLIQK